MPSIFSFEKQSVGCGIFKKAFSLLTTNWSLSQSIALSESIQLFDWLPTPFRNNPIYQTLHGLCCDICFVCCRASRYGKTIAVKKLLNLTAKIDGTNINGQTALHLACLQGEQDIVQVLLENGACVTVKNLHNSGPAHLAAKVSYRPFPCKERQSFLWLFGKIRFVISNLLCQGYHFTKLADLLLSSFLQIFNNFQMHMRRKFLGIILWKISNTTKNADFISKYRTLLHICRLRSVILYF